MNYLKRSTHLHLSAEDKDSLFGNLLQIYEFSRYGNRRSLEKELYAATFRQITFLIKFQIQQVKVCYSCLIES